MSFLYWLESIRCPFLDAVMQAFTCFGEELAFLLLALTIFWCVSKEEGYYLLFVGFFGTVLNQFLKLLCRIPRPWVRDPSFTIVESARSGAGGYSFPSGHTQNAVGTLGGIARWHKNRALRIVCIVLAALTAFSRMYLGVHTPLDVGVSLVSGLALTLALWPLFRDIESHPGRMYAAIGAMLALTLAYLLYVELYPFPADTDAENLASALENGYKLLGAGAAMLLSYALDRKYIHFETKAPLPGQVLKCVIGLALVMGGRAVLKAPLYALFGNPNIADAARYFIMVFVAAAGWPMTFRFFARVGK